MIKIKNLHVDVEGKPIIKGLDLEVAEGQIHAIMGPNGAGKSTFAKVLAGHPTYEVTEGEVWFKGQNILELDPEQRAHLGMFMSFQYPVEIPGVSNTQFLEAALNAKQKALGLPELDKEAFENLLHKTMEMIEVKEEFKERNLNEGFSGGEKKRNEILQMALLDPDLAILDETDSGLDIDAIRIVSHGVNKFMTKKKGLILITHYQRLLNYIKPDFVHVMSDGKIVKTGGPELALELEERGYDWI
ncbi:MAG: Fe-S cluster assembly ATPase SufC [Parachlamydiaceae bacterium]